MDIMSKQKSERNTKDLQLREEFIRTGKVPFGLTLSKGIRSIISDPWLLFVQQMPGPLGFKLRQWYWRRRLGSMGKGVVIDPLVELTGTKNIFLDDFCFIGRLSKLVSHDGYIRIGKRCHILSWIIGNGGVEIGDYVGCGGYILSATDSYKGGYRMAGPMILPEQRNIKKAPIVIENDAFIGHFSMVMPGVRIGQGALVGPHSLVVSNIPPWTVVMGSPAKIIGKREPVRFDDSDSP